MRTFVLRARAAPTERAKLLAAVGSEAHPEILAHALMNAIFVAQSHRDEIVMYLALESSADYSRTIRFDARTMRDIGGFHEAALLARIGAALDASRGMGKDELRLVEPGLVVQTTSFRASVKAPGCRSRFAGDGSPRLPSASLRESRRIRLRAMRGGRRSAALSWPERGRRLSLWQATSSMSGEAVCPSLSKCSLSRCSSSQRPSASACLIK